MNISLVKEQMLLGEGCEMQVDIPQLKAVTQNEDDVLESMVHVATWCCSEKAYRAYCRLWGSDGNIL